MSRRGKILIANPAMPKTNPFYKSVIYLYVDDASTGSVGLVLNKPSGIPVQKVFYDNKATYPPPEKSVYMGGPVNPNAICILHTDEWQSQNTMVAGNNLLVSSDQLMFLKMSQGNEPVHWRITIGISSWSPGQLDMELAGQFPYNNAHKWLTATPTESILFEYDGEEQWSKALELCSKQTIDQWI